jgi:hypothetical protein
MDVHSWRGRPETAVIRSNRRGLSRSFRNGIQQYIQRERLAQIAMHPASIASLRVTSSSLAVMKMTGHFDPDAASRRCSLIPEMPRGECQAASNLPSARLHTQVTPQPRRTYGYRCRGALTAALRASEGVDRHQPRSQLSAAPSYPWPKAPSVHGSAKASANR